MSPNIHAQKYMRCIGLGAAAAISAGASLAAGGATLWANSNMNKKNQKWNEKMVKQSRQWQEKMYNQYNSPQAQAQQLAAAGVNPYNQGGASTTPMSMSTSAPSAEQIPNDFGFIGEAGANVANTLLQKPAMEAQTLANRETEVRIEGMLTDNRIKLYDEMMRAIDAGNYEYAQMLNNERIREDIRLSKASRKEKLQSRKNMEKEFDILVEEYKEKQLNNGMLDDFVNDGGNTFTDNSENIKARTAAMKVDSADKHAMHELSYSLALETKEHNVAIIKAHAVSEAQKTNINYLFDIDYDSLPSYLKNEAVILYSLAHDVSDGKAKQTEYYSAEKEFKKQYDSWVTNEENRSNPNYQSDAEKTRLFYEFVNTGLGGSSKMLDLFGKSN